MTTYLGPLREELHHLRTENASLTRRNEALATELALALDTLRHRTNALQRTIDRPCANCANSQDAK